MGCMSSKGSKDNHALGPMYSENSPVNLKLGASRLVLVLCGTVLIHQQTFFESE
ncbi:hypothetical protein SCLCIDRAFT_1224513 [Scleroderma citrinum Foug A]|uniref:Uncharacterized protein n=1 Tax=Scleroderma citrinum Foug A TaxID=1036808 RepID=A0A0C3D5X3_9AGAM|nr:hypothetical protein SCLCIDRAFT_1224513 [Scleroderma citrinum Foug A]